MAGTGGKATSLNVVLDHLVAGSSLLAAQTKSGPRIGLLTGPVSVGKTTVAERVVGLVQRRGIVCGGLLAPALISSCGQKAGIWGVHVRGGDRRILARTDRDLGGPSVGPYSFDQKALAWAVGVIEQDGAACDLLVVDEIGKLELWHGLGLAPILPLLAAGTVSRSLVVVRDSLLSELRASLASVEHAVFKVRTEDRRALPPHIVRYLFE